ncbi:MAG: tRNA epoxyqueuosine(34) reductase QueG [Bacteroidales bacterium]|nr:tRNA epoxyqueuosine(34) reductase QueG [Bacteroidales bacterium]
MSFTKQYIPAAVIKAAAVEAGAHACGLSKAEPLVDFEQRLQHWLDEGMQADMGYMERLQTVRTDPTQLVERAQSVVSILVAYDVVAATADGLRIASYALSEDYHARLKSILYRMIARLQQQYGWFEARPFVDTAPISDKSWAVRAGLGFRGRNTLLIHPHFGSFVNIGELVCNAATDYDAPLADSCGRCRRCVEACPNGALGQFSDGTVRVDARRCTAYHTIESRAETLPSSLRTEGFVFGCDICQLVCPHNSRALAERQLPADRAAHVAALAEADRSTFKRLTKHTAMSRIGYEQWQRNVQHARQGRAEHAKKAQQHDEDAAALGSKE